MATIMVHASAINKYRCAQLVGIHHVKVILEKVWLRQLPLAFSTAHWLPVSHQRFEPTRFARKMHQGALNMFSIAR